MGKTNYSYKTSLPPYRENSDGKKAQKQKILEEIQLLGGHACLKQIEQFMHIPQSSCAGRINDLIADGKVKHDGYIEFEGRLRKKFVVIMEQKIIPIPQPSVPTEKICATDKKDIPVQHKLEFGT